MKQLFLDDEHNAERSRLLRVLQRPEKVSDGPIVVPDRPWEVRDGEARAGNGNGSVLFDPDERTFKMWYETWGPDGAALSIVIATTTGLARAASSNTTRHYSSPLCAATDSYPWMLTASVGTI